MSAGGPLGDTIVAVATAPGPAGVGVLRLSGPQAVAAVEPLFRASSGAALKDCPPRCLCHGGLFRASGEPLDQALVARFPAPHSFTGEDVVEVQAHGGSFHLAHLQAVVLESAVALGLALRPARPGEFTQRAFLNGKLDLTRAEAVADLIHSDSALAREAAARQLAGGLRDAVEGLRAGVLGLLAECEAACDFPEEQEQLPDGADVRARLDRCLDGLDALLGTARFGRAVNRGLRVVLVGAPNAGKSSLLNALCGEERAIVAAEPGTTRDWLEARVEWGGLAVALCDTAGLREARGPVEAEGVRRALALAGRADALLFVLDGSAPLPKDALRALGAPAGDALLVLNKDDLAPAWTGPELGARLASDWAPSWGDAAFLERRLIRVSARSKRGVEALKIQVRDLCLGGRAPELARQALLTQARHEDAARRARAALARARAALDARAGVELLAVDLRTALDALGEIVGAKARAEVVDEIFRRFCIGK